MKRRNLNNIAWLLIGLITGILISLAYKQNKCQTKVLHITKDTIITLKVDKLRENARMGSISDYEYLKQYFQQKGYPEEILYYSMIMADSYHYYSTCDDVCNSLKILFNKYKLGIFDNDTRKLFLYYQEKSDSILSKK